MEKENIWSAQDVIGMCEKYMNEEHVAMVRKACDFASYVHREQFRKSGEPYIIHPIQVAGILADLKMDPETVSAGFLHDVVEDTPVTLGDVGELFGKDVEVIVDGIEETEDGVELIGHAWFQAPDCDGAVHIASGEAAVGDIVTVDLVDSFCYEMVGEIVKEAR